MKTEKKRKFSVKSAVRKSAKKVPQKYALVILHAESPPSKDPEKKKTPIDYISLAIDLVIFGYLAGLGTYYYNQVGFNRCAFEEIPILLMVAGYTNIGLSILRFIVPLVGTVLQCCANLCIAVFGVVVVFPAYSVWVSDSQTDVNYCHMLPFLTAFIYVILVLVWLVTVGCVTLAVLFVSVRDRETPKWTGFWFEREKPKKQAVILSKEQLENLVKDMKKDTARNSKEQRSFDALLMDLGTGRGSKSSFGYGRPTLKRPRKKIEEPYPKEKPLPPKEPYPREETNAKRKKVPQQKSASPKSSDIPLKKVEKRKKHKKKKRKKKTKKRKRRRRSPRPSPTLGSGKFNKMGFQSHDKKVLRQIVRMLTPIAGRSEGKLESHHHHFVNAKPKSNNT